MSDVNMPADIQSSFVVVNKSLLVDVVAVTDTIWADLDARYGDFAGHSLIASFSFDEDWPGQGTENRERPPGRNA